MSTAHPRRGRAASVRPTAVCLATLSALFLSPLAADAADKVIGGSNVVSGVYTDGTAPTAVEIGESIEYDEIIGGHHVKQIKNEGAGPDNLVTVTATSSSVKISATSGVQYVVGGSKSNNSYATLATGTSSVEISDGTIGTASGSSGVVGGNLLKATLKQLGNKASGTTEKTTVTISGGTFTGSSITGGSVANVYYDRADEALSLSVTDKLSELVITGGNFTDAGTIAGGAVADGPGARARVVSSSVTLKGGTFDADSRQSVYGGSVAVKGGTASNETSSLTLEGGDGFAAVGKKVSLTGNTYLTLYGGGLNAAVTKLSSLTVSNAVMGYKLADSGSAKKVQLYSGSHYETPGTYTEGNSSLTVTGSQICGDIRGSSWVGPSTSSPVTGYTVTAGHSEVNVSSTSLDGYTKGNSTWNGRIFGAGILQFTSDSTYTVASTKVTASDIVGTDTEEGSGEITHNPGSRIFGGGQMYSSAGSRNNTLSVGQTEVSLTGAKSEVMDVIGGSIVSGTTANSTNKVVLGSSTVTVTDAYVSGRVLGGNDVNWFGTGSVTGDTAVTVNGAAKVNTIIGANTATFWGGYMFGDGVREADMTGNTAITAAGTSQVSMIIGGGYAESSHESGIPSVGDGTTSGRTEDDLNSAAVSKLTGNTSIKVTENAAVTTLVGAGFSWSDSAYYIDDQRKQTQRADATMTGTASSSVEGGSVGLWVLGGLSQGYGISDIKGNAEGTLAAGTADTVVVGGLGSEVTVYDLNYDSSTKGASLKDSSKTDVGSAAVSGDAVLTVKGGTLGRVILGGALSDLDGNIKLAGTDKADAVKVAGTALLVIAGGTDLSKASVEAGSADTTRLQFGTADSAWTGSFAAFTGLDEVVVSEGSELSVERFTDAQMAAEGLTLSGAGLVKAGTLDHASGALTLASGTLSVGTLAMSESGSLALAGGALSTGSGQIFTTGLTEAGTELDAGALTDQAKDHVKFEGGVLSLTDAAYNLYYASSAAQLVGSATEVVFTGTLVSNDETDTETGSISVSDYNDAENPIAENVVFAGADLNATEETGANLTIGKSDAEGEIVIAQSIGVGTITLKEGADSITVNDGKMLTLVATGGNLVNGSDNVTIHVGGQTDAGTLRLGSSGSAAAGGVINTAVDVSANGTVAVQAGDFASQKAFVNAGTVEVAEHASLALGSLTNTGSVSIEGSLKVESLTKADASAGGLITVGSDKAAGSLYAGGESLGGNTIFLDPVWTTDGTDSVEHASEFVTTVTTLDGSVIVGRNSYAALGTDSADAFLSIFERSGLTWGENGVTAAAYLASPINVANGSLVVDGSLTAPETVTAGTVRFGAGSLLAADVSALQEGNALITGAASGSVTVDAASRLILSGVTAGTSYELVDGVTTTWTADNISAANAMFGSAQTNEDGTVSFTLDTAENVYGGLMQGHALADAALGGDAAGDEYAYADALLTALDGNKAAAAKRFDAAMNPAGALSVYTNALDRAGELRLAVREQAADAPASGLWARVTGGRTELDGIGSGAQSIHTDIDAYGLALGGEYALGEGVIGAAFAAGTGSAENDEVSGKDDFDYYGLSFYGRLAAGGFDWLADASVTWLRSDISIGGAAAVDTDTTTTVWSIGGQVRRTFDLGWADLTPFVGMDVYHIDSDGFENGHGARIENADATTVEFPIGARLARAFKTAGGMNVNAHLSLAAVPAAGDTDIDSHVTFAGATSNYNFTFADDFKVRTNLGVSAGKGNLRFGVKAGYDWGSEERQAFTGSADVKFLF